jgi:copper(I)-binding protein
MRTWKSIQSGISSTRVNILKDELEKIGTALLNRFGIERNMNERTGIPMKIHRGFFLFFLITGLFLDGSAHSVESGKNIVVNHVWIRAMPPSTKNTAAYMTIENRTGVNLFLRSASSTVAQTVEIHRMEQIGDMMAMKKVDSLLIPAGKLVVLKPNGFHLMVIHLLRPLKEGETIPIVLYFTGGNHIVVNAVVRKWGEDG